MSLVRVLSGDFPTGELFLIGAYTGIGKTMIGYQLRQSAGIVYSDHGVFRTRFCGITSRWQREETGPSRDKTPFEDFILVARHLLGLHYAAE